MDGLHHNCTTESDTFRRVEVITGVARRRRWPASEKARIVAESYAPGTSATAVALRYGLHRNQIFGWRRQFRDGAAAAANEGTGFVPVVITSCASGAANRIEVISGGVTIRVGAGFDAGDLRRVLLVVRELG
jgi:transposase